MNTQDAAVAQSVVRRIGSAEVTGPIPVSSLLKDCGIPYKMGGSAFCFFWKSGTIWYGSN